MKAIVFLQLMLLTTWVTCKSPFVANEFRSSLPEQKWKPVTRSEVLNPQQLKWSDVAVTSNPRKGSIRQNARKYLPNPRKKRQKLHDDQIEIPQVSQGMS